MEEKESRYQYRNPSTESLLNQTVQLGDSAKRTWTVIHCPQCNHPTPASNLDLSKTLGKCDHCNAVFSFKENAEELSEPKKPSGPIDIPDGIVEMDHGYGKELWCKLKPSYSYYWIAFFSALFAAFCFWFIYWTRTSDKGAILFLDVIFSLTGAMGIYGMIDFIMKGNGHTKIKIDEYRLSINYPGLKKTTTLNIEDLEKAYLQEYKTTDMDGHQKSAYNLMATTQNGEEKKLLKNLFLKKQGQYIEQEINKYLKR